MRSSLNPYIRRVGTIVASNAIVLCSILMGHLTACSQLAVQQTADSGAFVVDTLYSSDRVLNHLRRLNAADVNGRSTGSIGFARAATYASEQFAAAGLSPMSEKEYLTLYTTKIDIPGRVSLSRHSPDSLRFNVGDGVLGIGVSEASSVQSSRFVLNPSPDEDLRGVAAVVTEGKGKRDLAQSFVDRGAAFVLYMDSLTMEYESLPVKGLVAAQVEESVFTQLLGKQLTPGIVYSSPFEVELSTQSISQLTSSAINVMALIPGANPVLKNELVVVAAALDGFGTSNGLALTDGSDLAVAPVAMMEAARLLAGHQRLTHVHDRSVLLVLWSGSKQNGQGASAFFRHPPWPWSKISSLIHLTNGLDDVDTIREAVEHRGVRYVDLEPGSVRMPNMVVSRAKLMDFARLLDEVESLVGQTLKAVSTSTFGMHGAN